MPSKRHKQASDLFRAACEIAPEARAAFLEEACAGDSKLRAEVEALLAQDEQHPSFLETPKTQEAPANPGHTTRTGKPPAGAAGGRTAQPEQIGPYRILEKIGEGGMGVVYVAEQREPVRRKVALKVIKLGMDTKQVLARFEVEHHALTIMNHPNIARVYDAGATPEGRPYFVMEHVPGIPINDYCDRHLLNTRQRLELFIPVCHAVQHAHQKSVIHRDLKPSNVLVTMQDGKPVPKIIDFGVAKATGQRLTERTLHTEIGQVIGTPEYMSPEQAEMTAIDIDTRTDIYSLGVILYELLVGAMPFDPKSLRQAGYAEIRRIIREVDPPRPSTRLSSLDGEDSKIAADHRGTDPRSLARFLRGDLDWIVLKALEKDRTRRYETANSLGLDVQRHLNDEPVLASPPGKAYQVSKFVRRNRGMVAAATVVLVTLVAGLAGTAVQYFKAEDARAAQARKSAELERVTNFQQRMLGEVDAYAMGRLIIEDLRARGLERLEASDVDGEDIARAISGFDEVVGGVNATDLGVKVIDDRILARAGRSIDQEFAEQPLARAALQLTVGATYQTLGLFEEAERYTRRALEGRRRVLGDEHPDTDLTRNRMGNLLSWMERFEEAELYLRESEDFCRRVYGDEHLKTMVSLSALGNMYKNWGRYDRAEPYLRAALEGNRRLLGDDGRQTLISLGDLGELYAQRGHHQQAVSYLRASLEGKRRVLGDEHPDTLDAIRDIGRLLMTMGRFDEAEPYFRELLETCRRVLDDDHDRTLRSIHLLGALLVRMGRHQEAEPYYREELEGRRRVLGDEHTATLSAMHDFGHLLERMGKFDEAEPYYRDVAATSRRVLGDNSRRTLVTSSYLARVLAKQGRTSEAEQLIRQVIERSRTVYNQEHWRFGNFHGTLGFVLTSLERYEEAETALLDGHRVLAARHGDNSVYTIQVVEYIADLYAAWHAAEPGKGYDAKAAEWRAKLPQADEAAEPAP